MRRFSRREVLVAAGALGVGCRAEPVKAPVRASPSQPDLAEWGHRLREAPALGPVGAERVDVLIVGAGVAGLSAGWRLGRAGFQGSVLTLELADRLGGTAAQGTGPNGDFPLGAHYLTLPSPEATSMRALLEELGIIEGWRDGKPLYRTTDLCFAPEERLFVAGEWIEGLWPGPIATAQETAELERWEELVQKHTRLLGADGLPGFAIPVANSSKDPAIRALAEISFARWLDQQQLSSPALLWLLEYACRDDYGTTLATTSAWAGLHYHCARRPDPAEQLGTQVLTWPGGNGWLVQQLAQRAPGERRQGAAVRAVVPTPDGVQVHWEQRRGAAFEPHCLLAKQVILALPATVADRLVRREAGLRPDSAAWRVVNLHCDEAPASRGVPVAWDSVVYQGEGLGYVSSAHQTASYGGPTTLTWYQPLSNGPADQGRRELLAGDWQDSLQRALKQLRPAHVDLLDRVQSAEVMHWGHGTVRPVLGLHTPGALAQAAESLGAVHFAHTDLSGMSLFEEANWHGVRAAEQVMAALKHPFGDSLL